MPRIVIIVGFCFSHINTNTQTHTQIRHIIGQSGISICLACRIGIFYVERKTKGKKLKKNHWRRRRTILLFCSVFWMCCVLCAFLFCVMIFYLLCWGLPSKIHLLIFVLFRLISKHISISFILLRCVFVDWGFCSSSIHLLPFDTVVIEIYSCRSYTIIWSATV